MKKQHWDEIFEALWDGTRRAGDGLATLNRKQKLELDNFARRVKDKDVDLSRREFNGVDNPGPLAPKHAQNFAGGRYDVEVTTEDIVLFRGGKGDSPYATGDYWTAEPPMGEIQTRMDYAVEKYWLDAEGRHTGTSIVDTGYAVLIPEGTTMYVGPVASHGGILAGGGPDQIHIPKETPGLVALAHWDLS